MKMEFNEIIAEVMSYLAQAWLTVNPVLKWLGAILCYVVFPTETYVVAGIVVGALVLVDLGTKYYSISVKNGGLWESIKSGKISSNSMWIGTRKKIVSYFLIMILVGLSYRFEMLAFLGGLGYAIMFLRELQSILENLMDAGKGSNSLKTFYLILKRKNEQLLETVGLSKKEIKELEEERKKEG
jgi:phage-related holin